MRHSLDIKVDIPGHSIAGVDRMTLDSAPSEVSLIIRKGSEVTKVENGKTSVPFEIAEGDNFRQIKVKPPPNGSLRELTVHFKGSFQSPNEAQGQIKRGVAYLEDGIIGEEGVFLPSSALGYPNRPRASRHSRQR